MTPDQNPPVDPAALAAAAETKALPRFSGYREMAADEVLADGDMINNGKNGILSPTICQGQPVGADVGWYFRPIDPVPHPKGRKSTGLIDVAGKEIFEGDTIEGRLRSWNLPTMGEIVYSAEHGCWANKNEGGVTLLVEIDNIRIQTPEGTSPYPDMNLSLAENLRAVDLEGTSPAPANMWMADSRPLLAEIEKLSADRDAADKSLKAFVELEMEARRERDAARAEVSTLIDATNKAREALTVALEQWRLYYKVELGEARFADCAGTEGPVFARCLETKALLESPALVQALKGGA